MWLSCTGQPTAVGSCDEEFLYSRLDEVIDSANYYKIAKDATIEKLKHKIIEEHDEHQLQALNSLLYKEYAKYDSDAAFELVIANIERAQVNNDLANLVGWSLKKAYLYSASGLLKESYDLLGEIRPVVISRIDLLEYYQQMKYLHSHMEQYASGDNRLSSQYLQQKSNYTDSIIRVSRPNDKDYLTNKVWQHFDGDGDSLDYYCTLLEKHLATSNSSTHADAINAYAIARVYALEDNRAKFIKYLTVSAIADVRSCNHDIASFHELSEQLLADGDIDRAYKYLSYTLSKATSYGDRVRVMAIATLMDSTYAQLFAQNRKQSRNLTIFLFLLIISLTGLIILFYNWVLKNRKLRITLSNLDEANTSLDRHLKEIEEVNGELSSAYDNMRALNDNLVESNYIKENYICNTFEVCSTQIAKMETIFVKITNLVRTNKLDELRRYCDSSLLLNAEIKVLYQAFDYTFLKMYPNFVRDLNTLFLEDKHVVLRDGETLNTELRILALNRLGVSDKEKIASILHCSMQTIYNNHQKTKNRSELSAKELHNIIMKIGS